MDFVSAVLILVVYFIRPQDWVPGLAGANLIQPIALFAIVAAIARRGVPSWREVFKGPLDWLVLGYGAYIVVTATDTVGALFEVLPLMAFYVVTRLAIDTPQRLRNYLYWWTALLVVIAAFGVGTKVGIDVTGAASMTEKFRGRLALGTWIHDNPNSLGHSVILAFPLVYIALFWRSTLTRRLIAVVVVLLAAYCVYLTKSRGSFVAALVVMTACLALGRPKLVQIGLCALVVLSATSIFAMLPRMESMSNLRSDEGVQGRMLAWEIARTTAQKKTTGEGWKEFKAEIEYEGGLYPKATHSCYVRVAGDLGHPGLFLYLAILWCCGRSLLHLRANGLEDEGLERSRRMLFALLIGYVVSGWMIDRSYHVEFFLMAAAISAAYRFTVIDREELEEAEHPVEQLEEEEQEEASPAWTRFGVWDGLASYGLVLLTLAFWDYILELV